ncbi:MAG: peptidase T [Bacteroidaceae bacterium]|nr:peptidase T [Bacteroidaceae bacterium]
MTIVERFINYARFDTQSAEVEGKCPSTDKQMVFAEWLKDELVSEGLEDVELDSNGYIYATLPANTTRAVPTVGFIAHMDTSPDCSGEGVKPRIVTAYDGGDIVLDAEAGIVTSPQKFPELLDHKGEDIIVTDGHTLLGADDKAGIAEIVQAMAYLREHPEIEHGRIRVAFTPDEEIGRGADLFDVKKFACDWAYTMDGSEVGELEYENFNAASAVVEVEGLSVHPGYAKGKMVNAAFVATQFAQRVPDERPETTEGYEGFYHLVGMEGGVERATLTYIIRDHDRQTFESRKQTIAAIAGEMNEELGTESIKVTLKDQYYNMREVVEPQMHIIDIAKRAIEETGARCEVKAIRGGTDGARLSFMGLPCPNIFAGGMNFHGRHEFLPIPSLERAMQVVVNIARIVAE